MNRRSRRGGGGGGSNSDGIRRNKNRGGAEATEGNERSAKKTKSKHLACHNSRHADVKDAVSAARFMADLRDAYFQYQDGLKSQEVSVVTLQRVTFKVEHASSQLLPATSAGV